MKLHCTLFKNPKMKYVVYENNVEVNELPGRSLRWMITPEMKLTKNFSMNIVSIKPGDTVKPAHSHPKVEEVIYVSRGHGKAYIDGLVHEICEGTVVLFKPGMIHMLRNDGLEEMKVVCIFIPSATLNDDYTFYEDIDFPITENSKAE